MTALNVKSTLGTDTAAVAVFDNHDFAETAVKQLASSGFDITKLTIVGRGYHTEEGVAGFYNVGDRVKFWGSNGAMWGGFWGLLMTGLFMTVPIVGPVVVVGHLTMIVVAAIEGAIVVGGLSALGAALYSIGIPKDTVVRYEQAVKADGFLVIVHGTPSEVERARAILQQAQPTQLDAYEDLDMKPSASTAHHAVN